MMKKENCRGLKGGPNYIKPSTEGYRANSPDRFNPYNVIPSGHISMAGVPHQVYGVDNMGNQMMMKPGGEYKFPGDYVVEIPFKKQGGGLYCPPKKFAKNAQQMAYKKFGGNAEAPQNMNTDGMIDYNKNVMKNYLQRNTMAALAMEEAEAVANTFNYMQMGGQYNMNPHNANAWVDAYGTMKSQHQNDFKGFIGEAGEMVGSIYQNPSELKLKKVKTQFTSPEAKSQYKQYKKDMRGMYPQQDPFMFDPNMMYQMGGQYGNGLTPLTFGLPPENGVPADTTGGNPQLNPEYFAPQYDYSDMLQMQEIPGLSSPDWSGGSWNHIPRGDLAREYGNRSDFGKRPDGTLPGMSSLPEDVMIDENNNLVKKTNPGTTKKKSSGSPSSTTSSPKKTIQDKVNTIEQGTPVNNGPRRGNYVEPSSSENGTATTQNPNVPGQNIFVTQPGYYGQSHNLFPGRTQRGRGMHLGPAVAYNPAETYLKSYDYKGRVFGKGPRRVKMEFDHFGKPGFVPQNAEEASAVVPENTPTATTTPPNGDRNNVVIDNNTNPAYNPDNKGTYPGTNAGTSPVNSTHGMMDKIGDINNKVDGYLPDPEMLNAMMSAFMHGGRVHPFPTQPSYPSAEPVNYLQAFYQEGGETAQVPQKTITVDPNQNTVDGQQVIVPEKFQGKHYHYNPNQVGGKEKFYQTGKDKWRSFWDMNNNPDKRKQHAYRTYVFQDGGQPIGIPQSEEPWAKTTGVWGRSLAGNPQQWADFGLAGMSMLSSFGEGKDRRAIEEGMKARMMGDAVFNPVGAGDASRGTWTVNRGDIRPDQMTPTQFQGANIGMIGSPATQYMKGGSTYEQGGEYYLSDDEINQIMKLGGQIEYLD